MEEFIHLLIRLLTAVQWKCVTFIQCGLVMRLLWLLIPGCIVCKRVLKYGTVSKHSIPRPPSWLTFSLTIPALLFTKVLLSRVLPMRKVWYDSIALYSTPREQPGILATEERKGYFVYISLSEILVSVFIVLR